MTPTLALVLGYGFVFWLVRADMQWRRLSSSALWIPALFFAAQGSRTLSYWIGAQGGEGGNLEGNSVNVLTNGTLLVASIVVLARRNFDWPAFARNNTALVLLYLYFALSALWSPVPFPTLKRVINDSICPLVALIVLSEPNPGAALRTMLVRVGYLLLPMSVVAVKYFPDVGRQFTRGGDPMVTGVASHKNSLGELVLILGLVLIWDIMETSAGPPAPKTKLQRWSRPGVLLIGLYLLIACQSATALVCFILGCLVLYVSKRLAAMGNVRQVMMAGVFIVISLFALDKAVDLSGMVLDALGRNRELTGRTEIWQIVFDQPVNPVFGYGFRCFWDFQGRSAMYEELDLLNITTAHSGYIDTYLNGGAIGVALLLIMLLGMGRTATAKLLAGDLHGRISLVFLIVALVHNFSETGFFLGTPLWIILLMLTIDLRGTRHEYRRLGSPTESDTVTA